MATVYQVEEPEAAEETRENSRVLAQAGTLVIRNAEEHGFAFEFLKIVARGVKQVKALFDPPKKAADAAHKAIVAAEKRLLAPLESARLTVEGKIRAYEAEERKKREEAEREAARALKAKQDQDAMESAALAEAAGDAEAADEILTAAAEAPAPVVVLAPATAKPSSVGRPKRFKAEVLDLEALAAWCVQTKQLGYVEPNMPAINAAARAQGKALAIPGVRVLEEDGFSVRTS